MAHYKSLYDDKEFLFAFDLGGREVTVTIDRCTGGVIVGEQGRKSKKPMLTFVGKQKKLALNKTNGKIIASLYGTETNNWAGKSIIIYPTTTTFGSETVECIRVKPIVPPGQKRSRAEAEAAAAATRTRRDHMTNEEIAADDAAVGDISDAVDDDGAAE
jgi:hypothetical protein